MSGQAQLLPGTLDLLILKAASLGPLHGYGILLRIGQISAQALLIEQGALYPALFRLVRQGLFKAECREARGGSFIDTLVFDARFSMRVLRKSPAFTAVAVLTLAVAIGANAVVFSVMDALVLRPLNVPDSGNLFMVERGKDKEG